MGADDSRIVRSDHGHGGNHAQFSMMAGCQSAQHILVGPKTEVQGH